MSPNIHLQEQLVRECIYRWGQERHQHLLAKITRPGSPRLSNGLGARMLKLWGAAGTSNLADGVFQVALSLLAVRLTRSPEAVAAVLLAARLPWLLLALHAGVVADRVDRLRVLIGSTLGRVLLIGGLALLTLLSLEQMAFLYAAAFCLGIAETLFDTSVHSLVPMIVESRQLERANSYLQAAELLMLQFLGPPLGGLLAGIAISLAFGASATMYLFAVLLLLWIGGRFRLPRRQSQGSLRRDIYEGLSFLWGHGLLRVFALVTGTLNIAFAAVLAILPLYAVAPGPIGLSDAGYGLLLTGTGLGGLAAALLTTRLEAWVGAARLLVVSIVGLALGFGMPALTANPILVACGLLLTGTSIFWNIVTVSLRQRMVPDHLLGRVNASYRLCAYGALPIGAALGGFVAGIMGLRAVFALSALLVLATVLPVAVLANPARLAVAEAEGMGLQSREGRDNP